MLDGSASTGSDVSHHRRIMVDAAPTSPSQFSHSPVLPTRNKLAVHQGASNNNNNSTTSNNSSENSRSGERLPVSSAHNPHVAGSGQQHQQQHQQQQQSSNDGVTTALTTTATATTTGEETLVHQITRMNSSSMIVAPLGSNNADELRKRRGDSDELNNHSPHHHPLSPKERHSPNHDRPQKIPDATATTIFCGFLIVVLIGLYCYYLSQFILAIQEWDDDTCDLTGDPDAEAEAAASLFPLGSLNSSGISYVASSSSTGVASALENNIRRTPLGLIYLYAVTIVQFVSLVATFAFAAFIGHESGYVSWLGAFVDISTLGVFVWGVYLYLSSYVCSFYFFKLTLVYCIVEIFLLILFINLWGSRSRIRRKQFILRVGGEMGDGRRNGNGNGYGHDGAEASRASSNGSRSSLPVLKPFQHPAFPPDQPVPLFVIQSRPNPALQQNKDNQYNLQKEQNNRAAANNAAMKAEEMDEVDGDV